MLLDTGIEYVFSTWWYLWHIGKVIRVGYMGMSSRTTVLLASPKCHTQHDVLCTLLIHELMIEKYERRIFLDRW